jgi:hypothetical protein
MTIVVTVLVWLAAAHRLLVLARTRTFLNVMYAAALVLAALALTVRLAQPAIDAALGVNTGDLLKHLLIVAMGAAIQLFILAVNVARPTRAAILRIVGLAAAVAAAMMVAFGLGHPAAGSSEDITPAEVPYLLIFNGYLAYVLINNVRLYRRFVAIPGDAGRAINLRLIGWGSAIALGYSATRFAAMLAVVTTGHSAPAVEAVGSAAAFVGMTLVALGVFAPGVVPWLVDWRSARHQLGRLDRLWSDLTATYPAVVLPAGGGLGRRTEFALERRLVEISESLRQVRLSEAAGRRVAGDPDPVRGLGRELDRSRPGWTTAAGPTATSLLPTAADRAEESTVLLALADAYTAAARVPAAAEVS